MAVKERLSITDVARSIGVTPRTIMRWEKSGKIKKSKRDWRGWRFYHKDDVEEIRKFYENIYEYNGFGSPLVSVSNGNMANVAKALLIILTIGTLLSCPVWSVFVYAGTSNIATKDKPTTGVKETEGSVDIVLDELPAVNSPQQPLAEPVTYTLGPDDVISIEVRRPPEFSGQYTVNSEGKIEYKYVGDVIVSSLTKTQLKERLRQILSEYIIEPDIDVQIVAYLSKVFYVVGEVGRPGKFYMRGNTIGVREALVQAGLPTYAAAMRRCRLITPDKEGKCSYLDVNVYDLLYQGDLRQDLVMKPGDVLYIPATVMAKIIRVIAPVGDSVREGVGTASSAARVAITGGL